MGDACTASTARTPTSIKGTAREQDRLATPALQQQGTAQHSRSRTRKIWGCKVQDVDLDAGEAVGDQPRAALS